jgi:hypothetical protein
LDKASYDDVVCRKIQILPHECMYTLHRDNLKSNKGHRDILQYCVFFMVFAMLSLLCSAACTVPMPHGNDWNRWNV